MRAQDKKKTIQKAIVRRVLEGDGVASRTQRRGAFDDTGLAEPLSTLVHKVATQPSRITDDDVDAVKAAGLSEDEILELVVCATVGQATRQYETALQALAEAVTDTQRSNHAS